MGIKLFVLSFFLLINPMYPVWTMGLYYTMMKIVDARAVNVYPRWGDTVPLEWLYYGSESRND